MFLHLYSGVLCKLLYDVLSEIFWYAKKHIWVTPLNSKSKSYVNLIFKVLQKLVTYLFDWLYAFHDRICVVSLFLSLFVFYVSYIIFSVSLCLGFYVFCILFYTIQFYFFLLFHVLSSAFPRLFSVCLCMCSVCLSVSVSVSFLFFLCWFSIFIHLFRFLSIMFYSTHVRMPTSLKNKNKKLFSNVYKLTSEYWSMNYLKLKLTSIETDRRMDRRTDEETHGQIDRLIELK